MLGARIDRGIETTVGSLWLGGQPVYTTGECQSPGETLSQEKKWRIEDTRCSSLVSIHIICTPIPTCTHEHAQTKQIQGWESTSVGGEMPQVQFLAWPELYRKNTVQEGSHSSVLDCPASSPKLFLSRGDLLLPTL